MDDMAEKMRSVVAEMDAHGPSDLDGNPITPDQFQRIKDCEPAKTAFVDGGNGVVKASAAFTASLNRVCFTMYEGERRIEARDASFAEFFSFTEFKRRDKTFSETSLFPRAGDEGLMPDEDDLTANVASADQRSRIASLPRKFAEWKMAAGAAIGELDSGDILVIDGSLQTGFEGNEAKYARELYDMAEAKDVTLCGLSKTSMAMTKAGHLLLPPIHKAGLESLGRSKWFVSVGTQKDGDDRGHSLVVRLHEESDYVFRLEILDKQYSEETAARVAASLASNARDASIPGYPYGAIEADNVARVRRSHARAAENSLLANFMYFPEWGAYERSAQSVDMHDRLNQVA